MLTEPTASAKAASTTNPSSETNGSPNAVGAVWGASARALITEGLANGTCDSYRAALNLAAADFAERNGCVPTVGETRDCFGFGEVPIQFIEPSGEFWCALSTLVEPTGVNYPDLLREFRSDIEDELNGCDVMSWEDDDGNIHWLELVTGMFAMRVLAGVSPWRAEFSRNMQAIFRNALVGSGLADALGPVVRINDDGTVEQTHASLGEFLTEQGPPTSKEEALRQAFTGPAVEL